MKTNNEIQVNPKLLQECISLIKSDPSGIRLTKALNFLHTKRVLTDKEKNFYFFAAEFKAYGANLNNYHSQ